MSAKRVDMHKLQEVVRLHRMGRSRRGIARQLRIGRDTIRQYFEALANAELLDGPVDDLPDVTRLREVIERQIATPEPPEQQRSSVERYRDKVAAFVKKGVGPTPIHDFLRTRDTGYDGSLSAVKRLVIRLRKELGPRAEDVAIPVETVAGEVAQVDFGYVGKTYDPAQGLMRKAWVFVMTLGHSRHCFCEIVFDQTIQTWLMLHVQAFAFFGGVPKVIVPDNLKAAVIRAAFGVDDEVVLNRSYRELARYYGFQIDPTPPRSPEKKGKVERSVRYVKGSFFATWKPVDIDEDRKALRRWLLEIASRRRHGTTGKVPIEVFEVEELPALLPLPQRPWTLVIWKKARLHRDSHVQIDGSFYSAPWRFMGEDLWVRCTLQSVEIHRNDERIATHARVPRGQRSTVDLHLPEQRRDHRHRSREYWQERARAIGPEVERLVDAVFDSDDVLLLLRKVQAIVGHLEGFPPMRARRAAERALHFQSLEYRAIKSILAKGLDLEPLPEAGSRDWMKQARFARDPSDFQAS